MEFIRLFSPFMDTQVPGPDIWTCQDALSLTSHSIGATIPCDTSLMQMESICLVGHCAFHLEYFGELSSTETIDYLSLWPSPIEPLDRRSWGQRSHFAAPVYSTSSFDWQWTLRLFYRNSSPEVPVRNVKSLFMFLALAQDVLRFWYRSRGGLITHPFSHVYWHQSIKIINVVAIWVRRRPMHRKEDGTFLGHQYMRMACRIAGT